MDSSSEKEICLKELVQNIEAIQEQITALVEKRQSERRKKESLYSYLTIISLIFFLYILFQIYKDDSSLVLSQRSLETLRREGNCLEYCLPAIKWVEILIQLSPQKFSPDEIACLLQCSTRKKITKAEDKEEVTPNVVNVAREICCGYGFIKLCSGCHNSCWDMMRHILDVTFPWEKAKYDRLS